MIGDAAVRSRVWRAGALQAEDFPFEKISDYLDEEDCLVWVDICDPDSHLLTELASELALDPLAVEDAISHGERAKATRYSTHTFLTAYAAHIRPDDDTPAHRSELTLSRVSAFVLTRGIVTVRRNDDFDMEVVSQRWEDNADLLKYGVGALVHGLLDVIVDSHFEAVQALDEKMEMLEDGLFDEEARTTAVQRQTYSIRKDLVALRRVVLPMREVVNSLLRHRKDMGAHTELDSWYDDLYDHVLRATEWTESLRDMVTTIFETNLSLQDARLNTVMKKLTGWAAIIAIPTAITGYFGQNVPYPGFQQPWGWVLSSGLIVGIAGLLYLTFKRREWL
ncbi:magnesium transporter CorA family protein [Lapillicoccus sp.]|uniref:magnesium transporter CorA family protein n=1 Tax=Lapillicoccus sp. TaxID=1909287 RepID=UPI0025DF9B37|nr:magnesium transporter CorA family protein [Lapillicoccus sp.]